MQWIRNTSFLDEGEKQDAGNLMSIQTKCWWASLDRSAYGMEYEILQQAIITLLSVPRPCRLRFVLVGNGLLHEEMRSALAAYEKTGAVTFTGSLSSDKVAEYLDASDILVSPHIPMPDGSRFFGSPTKLFEYMAMGKGIVASRLEQLAEVLEHDRTAWLITPGDVNELADAIYVLPWIRQNVRHLAPLHGVPRSSVTAGPETYHGH